MGPKPEEDQEDRYVCPNDGEPLRFAGGTTLVCPVCGYTLDDDII